MAENRRLIFWALIISFLAGIFISLFVFLGKPYYDPDSRCVLMRNSQTQELGCYGCSGRLCIDPSPGWVVEEENSDRCIATSEGCKLKQDGGLSLSGKFCGISTDGPCSTDSDCTTGGCSGQVCQSKSEEQLATTCEWLECYDSKKYNVGCKCVKNKCQWSK